MATSTAAKPYVVQDSVVAPQAETRSGWVTFAGVVLLVGAVGTCSGGSPRSTARATSTRPGCCTAPWRRGGGSRAAGARCC